MSDSEFIPTDSEYDSDDSSTDISNILANVNGAFKDDDNSDESDEESDVSDDELVLPVIKTATSTAKPLPLNKPVLTAPKIAPIISKTEIKRPSITPAPKLVLRKSSPIESTNLDELVKSLDGITISGVTLNSKLVPASINDLLRQEEGEDWNHFETRRKVTMVFADNPNVKINCLAALVIGKLLMNKLRFNVKYDNDVELALEHLIKAAR